MQWAPKSLFQGQVSYRLQIACAQTPDQSLHHPALGTHSHPTPDFTLGCNSAALSQQVRAASVPRWSGSGGIPRWNLGAHSSLLSFPYSQIDLSANPVAFTLKTYRFPPLTPSFTAFTCISSMAAPWHLLPPFALVLSHPVPTTFLPLCGSSAPPSVQSQSPHQGLHSLKSPGPAPL